MSICLQRKKLKEGDVKSVKKKKEGQHKKSKMAKTGWVQLVYCALPIWHVCFAETRHGNRRFPTGMVLISSRFQVSQLHDYFFSTCLRLGLMPSHLLIESLRKLALAPPTHKLWHIVFIVQSIHSQPYICNSYILYSYLLLFESDSLSLWFQC